MKKISFFFVKLLIKLIQLIQSILNRATFYLDVLKIYINGNECAKLKDCFLLQTLRKKQPPGSDRYIEYPWMLENISISRGRLLDIGSTKGDNLYELLPKTIEINCININEKKFKHKEIKFFKGDIRNTFFPDNYFDCATCISTLEHIGVSGRYGNGEDREGDIKAMKEIRRTVKPGGILILTVPYGIRDVLPINKLYNKKRIEKLLEGFNIINNEFRKYNPKWAVWLKVSEEEAAVTDMIRDKWYAINLIKAVKL
ncbi:MAG: class I SAM-dependent methyltransferase [bacterium]